MRCRRLPPFCLPLAALAIFASSAAVAGQLGPLAGIYRAQAAGNDAAQRVFRLKLSPDGKAILSTSYIGKGEVLEPGSWVATQTGVVLSFSSEGARQPPRPITFRYERHTLRPTLWDSSEWGRDGPPVFYRQAH